MDIAHLYQALMKWADRPRTDLSESKQSLGRPTAPILRGVGTSTQEDGKSTSRGPKSWRQVHPLAIARLMR
jgi:hypothetical protein